MRPLQAKAYKVSHAWSGYRALARVHLEAQAPLDETRDACHHALAGALTTHVDIAIVGVAHEAVTSVLELAIELVEHDVAQQRRQRTALRRSFVGADHHSIRHHH